MEKNNVNKNATNEFYDVDYLIYQLKAGFPFKIGCGDTVYIGNDQHGKTLRNGIVNVLDEYKEDLEDREFDEVRQAVNTIIDYCEKYYYQHMERDGCVECDRCAIYEFYNHAMNVDTLSELPKYKVDKEEK